jgi:DNA-binding transcriptional LysR family regulator
LELRQLKYFIAVAEEGEFSAAAMLPVKPQTLLGQIRKLENELGLRLFHRGRGGSRLTEAGRIFTRYARKVLSTAEKARRAMDDIKDGRVSGEIRIGTVDSVGIYFLPQVLRNMREKYPGVRLTVLYRNSNEILQALLSDRIDVALINNPRPDRHLRLETIIEEQVSLVCGRIIQTAKKMVEVGFGVTFLPDMTTSPNINCQGKSLGRLARIRLNPACNRRIVLATWKRSSTGRSTNSFVEEIRKHGSQWTPCSESGAA